MTARKVIRRAERIYLSVYFRLTIWMGSWIDVRSRKQAMWVLDARFETDPSQGWLSAVYGRADT